jgi:hypothetical protein
VNREDIIRMREQADDWAEEHLQCMGEYHPDFHTVSDERFAALVAAAEREECALAALEAPIKTSRQDTREACANAIRARGQV